MTIRMNPSEKHSTLITYTLPLHYVQTTALAQRDPILMFVAAGFVLCSGTVFLIIGVSRYSVFVELKYLFYMSRFGQLSSRARSQKLCLTREALEITRVSPHGSVQKWKMEPTWLQVLMDEPPQHHSKLRLRSHGKSLVIGTFLTPEERLQVAFALKDALHDWQSRSSLTST